jgi:hypothetical protein
MTIPPARDATETIGLLPPELRGVMEGAPRERLVLFAAAIARCVSERLPALPPEFHDAAKAIERGPIDQLVVRRIWEP